MGLIPKLGYAIGRLLSFCYFVIEVPCLSTGPLLCLLSG